MDLADTAYLLSQICSKIDHGGLEQLVAFADARRYFFSKILFKAFLSTLYTNKYYINPQSFPHS